MDPLLRRLRRLAGPDEPDARLLARHAAGDPAAVAELVRRHGPLVYATARRRLPDPADAADVFQATFLLLLQKGRRPDGAGPVGPWLYRVAALTARNLRRKNARRLARRRPLFDPPAADPFVAADLDDALLLLPERDRAAVVLCHLQGYSRREAAERLGLPEGTLSSVLSRALAKLRTRLGDPLPLLAAGAVAVPTGLATAAGPGAISLSREVVRMFWLKKLVAGGLAAAACVGLGVGVGLAPRPAAADQPPADERRMDELRKQAADAAAKAKELSEALAKEELRLRDARPSATMRPARVTVRVSDEQRPWDAFIRLEETDAAGKLVADYGCGGGRVGEVSMATHLRRALLDPTGPREVALNVDEKFPKADLLVVLRAVTGAGVPTAIYGGPTPRFDETNGVKTYNWGRGVTVSSGKPINLRQTFLLDADVRPEPSADQSGVPSAAEGPKFYLVVQKADGGESVTAIPAAESATVMDVLAGIWLSGQDNVWVCRRAAGRPEQVLPVDLVGITEGGDTKTNYQLRPGDRLYIKRSKP